MCWLASSSSGHSSIISTRSCEGRRLPSGPTANNLSIRWYLVKVCCCRRSSFKTVYGSSTSGWATAWKHSWMISLLRAAMVWSNLSHTSINPLALKPDSTWANHPAALSVQNGGSVIVLWLLASIVEWRCRIEPVHYEAASCLSWDYHYWDAVVELYIFIPQLTRINWLSYNWRIFSIHHYSLIFYPNPLADLLTISFRN